MKFKLNYSGENIVNLIRKIGYYYQGKKGEEYSLVRPPKGYPRFHLYVIENPDNQELFFNLHLDQKRPVYKYAPVHAGEYEGKIVEEEAERIKQAIQK